MMEQALAQTRYRQREAAVLLGLSYDQFRGLYRKFQHGAGAGVPADKTGG